MKIAERKTTVSLSVKEWYVLYQQLAGAGREASGKEFNVAIFKSLKNIRKGLKEWDERQGDMSAELSEAIDAAEATGTTIGQLIADGDEEIKALVEAETARKEALEEEMSNARLEVEFYRFDAEEASSGVSGLLLTMLDENGMLLD